jgi:site-specific recombinase XerD
MMPDAMTTNNDLVNAFLAYLRAERGAGENTLASYEHDVRDLSAWLEKPLPEATRIDLQEHIRDSLKHGIGARSVTRRLSSLSYLHVPDNDAPYAPTTSRLPCSTR